MAINRRTFLAGTGASLASVLATSARALTVEQLFVAAREEADGSHAAAIFNLVEGDIAHIALPGRGHDAIARPGQAECVMFARRPGNFAVAFSHRKTHEPLWFTTPPARHFYGHGAFSADGKILYSTENEIHTGNGVIGVRDATARYQSVGHFPSHGMGPHDIALLPDNRTLVIANGGIETHPNSGRTPLNLATMQPSLVYMDRTTGDLLERHTLPAELHKLSIRHIGSAANGTIIFGCQDKRLDGVTSSLIGIHRRGEDLTLIDMPRHLSRKMRSYVSSIDIDKSGEYAVATSARGSLGLVIDISTRKIIQHHRIADVSGVTRTHTPGEFLLSNGLGDARNLQVVDDGHTPERRFSGTHWDNHLAPYGL